MPSAAIFPRHPGSGLHFLYFFFSLWCTHQPNNSAQTFAEPKRQRCACLWENDGVAKFPLAIRGLLFVWFRLFACFGNYRDRKRTTLACADSHRHTFQLDKLLWSRSKWCTHPSDRSINAIVCFTRDGSQSSVVIWGHWECGKRTKLHFSNAQIADNCDVNKYSATNLAGASIQRCCPLFATTRMTRVRWTRLQKVLSMPMRLFDAFADAHCSDYCVAMRMSWNYCCWGSTCCSHLICNCFRTTRHSPAIRPAAAMNKFHWNNAILSQSHSFLLWAVVRLKYLNALELRKLLRSCRAAFAFFTLCLICSNVDWWNLYAAQSGEHCPTLRPSSDFICNRIELKEWFVFIRCLSFGETTSAHYQTL